MADLVAQLGHLRPGVVDVGDAVSAETGEIILLQEVGIADLDGITELRGQLREEGIEAVEEFPRTGEGAPAEGAEFEDEERGLFLVREEGADEHLPEHVRVEEGFILAAGLRAVARVDGVDLAGDLLRDFEGEAEVRGHVREEAAPEFLRGELVEGEIAADGGKTRRTARYPARTIFREAAAR